MLANLESRELRAAITQLYELLDQSVAPPEQARLLMLHAAQRNFGTKRQNGRREKTPHEKSGERKYHKFK